MRYLRWAIFSVILLVGCRAKPRVSAVQTPPVSTAPAVVRYAKPLLDFSRGIGGLPLICSQLPLTSPGLELALAEAHARRLILPAGANSPIIIDTTNYPDLRSMRVDISGAAVRPDYRPAEFRDPSITDHVLNVGSFDYRAWPVRFEAAEGFLRIHAEQVSMALLQENGNSCLVMTDARAGELEIAFSLDDLREAILTAARLHASKAGLSLRDLSISLHRESENQVSATMDVWGIWLFIPGHVRFTGRIHLDESFNAHVSGVDVRGADLGGAAMAAVLDGKIKQANGRVVPLVRFPGNRIRVRDVQMHVDDKWRLTAHFGASELSLK